MATAVGSHVPAASLRPTEPLRCQQALSLDELDAWEGSWHDLDAHAAAPFSQFPAVRAGYATLDDAPPHVVAAFRGRQMLAVAPLVLRRVRGVSRLMLEGASELCEPVDLSWVDESALDRLTRDIARQSMPMLLERVPADSPALKHLRRAFLGRAIVVTRSRPGCAYIPLNDTWLEPSQHLNARRRGDLRRARRRAEQSGPLTTEIHAPDLRELPELLDTAFEVESRSWKGQAGTALAQDAARAVFFRQYAQAACVDGVLRICFLRIGDRVAAMQLAVEHGGAFWLLKVGYDARFADCSPGSLLVRDTIRYAVEAGLASYEFLGTPEPWTSMWTSSERPCVSVRIYPFGLRGICAMIADLTASLYGRYQARRS